MREHVQLGSHVKSCGDLRCMCGMQAVQDYKARYGEDAVVADHPADEITEDVPWLHL